MITIHDISYSPNNEEERTEIIITSLLSRVIDKVLQVHKKRVEKLNTQKERDVYTTIKLAGKASK